MIYSQEVKKMHLYALNNEGKIIPVHQASKQQDYQCLECKGAVRRRGGKERIDHYFHLRPAASCRQQGKSLAHLQTQFYLQSIFPPHDCQLEVPFPSINRIADVVWFSKKLIFEVQCSPIHPEEIKQRNEDYASLGYQVVWILHDQRFNRWKLSAAENYLCCFPHYFANIDDSGEGCIYDQGFMEEQGMRKARQPAMKIDPAQPHCLASAQRNIPKMLRHRMLHWPIYFTGDLMHKAIHHGFSVEDGDALISFNWAGRIKFLVMTFLFRPYGIVFKMLLEKVCK